MFILHQLQPSDASYVGVGNSAFSTSYGELVVRKVEATPAPGFRYPVCPVTSSELIHAPFLKTFGLMRSEN